MVPSTWNASPDGELPTVIDIVPPPPPLDVFNGPTPKNVLGLDWLLYSVVTQLGERAMLDRRSSSSTPLNGKMAPNPLVDMPPATMSLPVLTGAVASALAKATSGGATR